MKITDKDFQLNSIFAESILKNLTLSANKPLIISGIDMQSFQKGEYVLKPTNGERMYPGAAVNELVASFIASELDILTPQPVTIELGDEFILSQSKNSDYDRIKRNKGLSFGTKYLPNAFEFTINLEEINKDLIPELQFIYIFDMFIDNPDRTISKPNMLINDKRVYVIDHELAFSIILEIPKNPKPWKINNEIAYKHCLLPLLKGRKIKKMELFDKFYILNDNFWKKMEPLIPKSWDVTVLPKIRELIDSKLSHLNDFKNELIGVLK